MGTDTQAPRVDYGLRHDPLRWRLEGPVGVLGEKCLYLCVVLLGLERACAVDQKAAAAYQASRGAQYATLRRGHGCEIGWLEAPTRVRVATESASSRARHVKQNSVDRADWRREGIGHENDHIACFHAPNGIDEALLTRQRAIGGDHQSGIARELESLPPGRRAEVSHGVAGRKARVLSDEGRRGILHEKQPLPKCAQLRERRGRR